VKILVIGRLPESEVGGLPLYTANLARAMSALGHELLVVHPGPEVEVSGFATRAAAEVRWPQAGRLRSFRQAFAVAEEARRAALEFAPDVIHLQYGGAMDLAILRRLTQRTHAPIVVTAHCGRAWAHLSRTPKLAARILRSASRVLVISDDQRRLFEAAGLAPESIHEVGSLIEPEFFEATPERLVRPAEARERAVYLGRIMPEKGLETVIAALERLTPEERPDFIATGPVSEAYRERLVAMSAAAGLSDCFHLAAPVFGVLARRAVLDTADFVLHPTHSDVKPLGLIEAMARSLPIVASSLPGTVQLCGGSAQHFAPGDAEGLAQVLLARHAARRAGRALCENPRGRRLARAFEPAGAAAETLAILEGLVARGVAA